MGDGTETPINGGMTGGAGINYGTGVDKYLPFSDAGSAWWNPGESEWLFGGGKAKNIPDKLQHGDASSSYIQQQLGGVNGRQAPTAQAAQLGSASQLNGAQQQQARDQMGGVTSQLQRIMSGNQAGAGELAVNRQVGQATAAQQSQARMARGANSALAARTAARNTADIGVAGAGQASIAQMQDQQGATGQLGQMLGTMRGQDIDYAGQNAQLQQQRNLTQAGFNQQTGLANQNAALTQTGMNDQASLGFLAAQLGIDKATLEAQIAKQKVAMEDKGNFGNLLQAGGSMLAASDRDLKTEIEPADTRAALDGIKPYTFRYKDEAHGAGPQIGVMAQDLEAAGLGHLVINTPEGKIIDGAKAALTALALLASVNERLAKLEERG